MIAPTLGTQLGSTRREPLVSYPSSAPHNSRHGPLVDFVPTGGKLSALAYATVSLFDVDRHWSIGPRQERVDSCHVFPGRHTSVVSCIK